jgi:hypothetical protein
LIVGALAAGCATSNNPSAADANSTTGATGAGAGSTAAGGNNGSGGAGGSGGSFDHGPQECPIGQFIYVLAERKLLTFDPKTLSFHEIGTVVGCGGLYPVALAISRDGVAYVSNMISGISGPGSTSLAKVSLADASCQQPIDVPVPSTFSDSYFRGLAFSAETVNDATETLYSVTGSMLGLAEYFEPGSLSKIDLTAAQATPIGSFTNGLEAYRPSLTGTGDGRLFGLFGAGAITQINNSMTLVKAVVAEINKQTGATATPIEVPATPGFTLGTALAFWGGDMWLFPADNTTHHSQVIRYTYSTDQSFVVEVEDTGLEITGAAVSTCAPVIPN